MSTLTVYDRLALHPLLADFPAGWLRRLSVCGTMVRWPASTRLLRVGSPVDQLWLLWSGAVTLDFHVPGLDDVPIETIGADAVVGWSCLIPPYRSTVGAFVVDECQAIEIRAAPLRGLIAEDPAFGLTLTSRMLEVAAQRLRTAQRRLTELCRLT
jgi:CRP/FNR family transcriptional regulator, cyclic AMP receptor protein